MPQSVMDAFREAERTPPRSGVRGAREKPSRPALLAAYALKPWTKLVRATMPKYLSRQRFLRDPKLFEAIPADCPPALLKAFGLAWQGGNFLLILEAQKRPGEPARRAWASFMRQSISYPITPHAERLELETPANEIAQDELRFAMREAHGPRRNSLELSDWFWRDYTLTPNIERLWKIFLYIYGIDSTEFIAACRRSMRDGHGFLTKHPPLVKVNGGQRKLLFNECEKISLCMESASNPDTRTPENHDAT